MRSHFYNIYIYNQTKNNILEKITVNNNYFEDLFIDMHVKSYLSYYILFIKISDGCIHEQH